MKKLLILSGKGGTGKTTIASAFIKLSAARAYADCDVDAPNLHLITDQKSEPLTKDFFGMPKAIINQKLCIKCDKCRQNCRFDAVKFENIYEINPFACEGCGVCEFVCPVNAICLKPSAAGKLMLYKDNTRTFSTAQLNTGSGNSGLLVTKVKSQINTSDIKADLAVIDGSPGIGCPVIASLNGIDVVLIVAEPSISGISDMERIIKTASGFGVKIVVCINKYDTNKINAQKIEAFCKSQKLPFAGKIPFDKDAIKAINNGQTIVDIDCISGIAVRKAFDQVMCLLQN